MAERAAAKLANAHEFITETQKALDRLMKDKTSIVIAHHLATIVRRRHLRREGLATG
jgi:ABC-type transport system involved in Fe-S cluster assembly fused permease/ATPase subunit